jgi:hypothetical protein
MQGRADVAAVMLLDLRDMEMASALTQIRNTATLREHARDASPSNSDGCLCLVFSLATLCRSPTSADSDSRR